MLKKKDSTQTELDCNYIRNAKKQRKLENGLGDGSQVLYYQPSFLCFLFDDDDNFSSWVITSPSLLLPVSLRFLEASGWESFTGSLTLCCLQGPRPCSLNLWEGHMGGACEAQAKDLAALRYQLRFQVTLQESLDLAFKGTQDWQNSWNQSLRTRKWEGWQTLWMQFINK